MELNRGDLSTFQDALSQAGFYGASATNPADMRNNCVSVSVCRLLGYDNVSALWQATYGYDLRDEAMNIDDIKKLLSKTGWRFQWQRFKEESQASAYQVMLRDIEIRFTMLHVVLYTRHDQSGHAVNAVFSNLMNEGPRLLRLVDWQAHHMGEPVAGDLEGAREIITVGLDWPLIPGRLEALVERYQRM